MKKFEAVLLLVVFVFNSIGPFLKFEFQRFKVWREVQELISTHLAKDMYTVTVTAENAHLIHWKHQREFTYRGLMFDVVSKKSSRLEWSYTLALRIDQLETVLK
jgi:hypothetical protein